MDMEYIIKEIFEIILPIMGAMLTALSSYAVSILCKRLGLKLDQDKQDQMRQVIRSGIAGAEEWAARKAKVDSRNVTGLEKAQWVHAQLKKRFPALASDELDLMIDQELAMLKDVGATGTKKIDV